ncbi:MAG TPA: hypothetical protein VLL75_10895 [Vicinamibacteria bacterium]|nr:hypothetical protein [Vicinamibacteria bacterium]
MSRGLARAAALGVLLAALGAGRARAAAEPARVTVGSRASKTEVAVGERFTVEVQAEGPAGTTFTFPPEIVTEGAELRAVAPGAPQAGTSPAPPPGVQRYEAAVFELTDAKVPPVTVKYRLAGGEAGEATTEPIALRTASRLPKDADPQKIADVRGPLALSIGRAFWIALVFFTLGLVLLMVWLVRRRRQRKAPAVEAPPPVDPAIEAREALSALIATGHLSRGDHRAFYIALTAIAKRYLERRLGAPVLEMTTAEMVAFLRDAPKTASLVGPMRDLAGAADRIKFARGAGLTAEAERHIEAVRSIIAALEAALAPPPPAMASEKVA